MAHIPEEVTHGPPWLQKAFAERDAYDQALQLVAGKGVSLNETEAGTAVSMEIMSGTEEVTFNNSGTPAIIIVNFDAAWELVT